MTGKGSKQRPTDAQKFAQGWEAVFGKKEREQVCSYPFCNCPPDAMRMNDSPCVLGLPWKKEEK